MSAYLQAVAVADAIGNLSVSGLTLKKLDTIPAQISNRDCPILIPNPDNYLTGISFSRESFGSQAQSRSSGNYTVNYILFYAQVGANRSLFEMEEGLIGMVDTLYSAIIDNTDLVNIDLLPGQLGRIGPLKYFTGSETYHACDIAFDVQYFVR